MEVIIYTDGSAAQNPAVVGFSSILVDGNGNQLLRLSTYVQGLSSVILAQALGIGMGLRAAQRITNEQDTIQVKCDNITVGLTWQSVLSHARKGCCYLDSTPKAQRAIWGTLLKDLILKVAAQPRNIQFTWIRGHNKNKYNQLADKLARSARKCR